MSSFKDFRNKQIREVIDEDKNINRRVYNQTFQAVRQFGDTLKQPSPLEKRVSYEIEKYIIEMESILIDIQTQLETTLAPYEGKLAEQIGEPVVQEQKEREVKEEEEEEEPEEEIEVELEGQGRRKKKGKLRGGVKEIKFSLLEIWNKFINYIDKLANLNQFSQRDLYVLYDRLDDLIPLLQNIIKLNLDAKRVNVPPIADSVVNILLQRIQNKNFTSIVPSTELPKLSSVLESEYENKIKELEKVKDIVLTEFKYNDLKQKFTNSLREDIKKLQKSEEKVEGVDKPHKSTLQAIEDRKASIRKKQLFLEQLESRWRLSQSLFGPRGSSASEIQQEINDLKKRIKVKKFEPVPVKSSRVSLKGQGKTAVSSIMKNFDDETLRIFEAIPSLSYDRLEDLFIDLQEKLKYAQENDDKYNWDKYNFLINAILSDDRAKEIQTMLGNGMKRQLRDKLSSTSMPLPFKDADNELYSY